MKKHYEVTGMTCAACVSHVDKAVKQLDGVKSCEVKLLTNSLDVEFDESKVNDELIHQTLLKIGYGIKQQKAKQIVSTSTDHDLIKLIVAIVILLISMYFSMGHMMWSFPVFKIFDKDINPTGFALIQLILTTPILLIYKRYFISGFTKLFKRIPNMDTLISIGSSISFIYGIFALFMISYGQSLNNHAIVHQYKMILSFESAGMILVFVSIGKYLEKISKKKTTKAIEKLMDLSPKQARIKIDDKEYIKDAKDVKVGDTIILKLGESAPVDGNIISGQGSFDQANITGESVPVLKKVGDKVYSSTTLKAGYVEFVATTNSEDSSISTIIKLVTEAANSKAPVSKLADKISGIFVPIILILAIITFIFNIVYINIANPSYVANAFETALNFAISVIVIACPCALGLATPVAIMVGTGVGANNGLLIRNAEILEKAHEVKTIVFDKTGTITEGYPRVVKAHTFIKDDLINNVVYEMESMSEHPLAHAIKEWFEDKKTRKLSINDFEQVEGLGLQCSFLNAQYKVGNKKFFATLDKEVEDVVNEYTRDGNTTIIVSKNDRVYLVLGIKDNIKPTSVKAIEALKKMNIKVIMLTGDNEQAAALVNDQVKADVVIANVLPTEKEKIITNLMNEKSGVVAMSGDGVNDALALTKADLSISLGSATDVAIESSDIILLRNDLYDVYNVISLSKRVLRTIKLGLFWAFFYNFICVILATGIIYYLTNGAFKIQPMHASIAMSLSSVSVVLNALSIYLFKPIHQHTPLIKSSTMTFKVKNMMCEHCVKRVHDTCIMMPGVINAEVSLKKEEVVLTYTSSFNYDEFKEALAKAGYEAL